MNKREMMDQVDCVSSKLVGNNTVEYMDYSGNRIIRHFHTDVLIFARDGSRESRVVCGIKRTVEYNIPSGSFNTCTVD